MNLGHGRPPDAAIKAQKVAIRLSLLAGVFMITAKSVATWLTGSSAILSDAAESVVHLVAVAFAAFSLSWSIQPADEHHLYGHQKIAFFSAGFEGAMIVLAALYILYSAIEKWLAGLVLQNLDLGIGLVAAAGAINAGLGWFLVRQGRKYDSLILEANGKHVLTDFWTSLGVVIGLLLTIATGWLPFDPLLAILVACNILWSGAKLIRTSFAGLMDEVDPGVDRTIRRLLDSLLSKPLVGYHGLRHRNLGASLWIEVHLLYAAGTSLDDAHAVATRVEAELSRTLNQPVTVNSHLEPAERHDETHAELGTGH